MRWSTIKLRPIALSILWQPHTNNNKWRPVITHILDRNWSCGFSTTRGNLKGIKSLLPNVKFPERLLNELMYEHFEQYSDNVAMECSITGRYYKYSELESLCKTFAANLRNNLGLQDGDVVTVVLPNVPEYAIVALAIVQANCVCSPLNPIYTADEFEKLLLNSDSKCVVTNEEVHPVIVTSMRSFAKKLPILIFTSSNNTVPVGTIDGRQFINRNSDVSILSRLKRASMEDVIFLPYSSGTTGLPKGVQLTHRNIVSNILQFTASQPSNSESAGRQDVIPAILPLYHIYGLVVNLLQKLYTGYKIVTLSNFNSDLFVDMLQKYRPSIMYVVPPIALLMATNSKIKPEHLQNVREVLSGAAPIGPLDIERLKKKISREVLIHQGYGLTETSPVIATFNKYIKNYNLNSVGGLVLNTEAKVFSLETGDELGPNETGELVVRGPQVMKGYYKNEKATSEVIDKNGWFRTGDLGYYDEEGQIFITDRLKELIKVKGFQVAPAELEEILRSHPDVTEAGVIGVPHPRNGEAPKAFIVTARGKQLSDIQIQEFLAERVAPFKQLTGGVVFIDSIPKSAAGKILRKELKQLANER